MHDVTQEMSRIDCLIVEDDEDYVHIVRSHLDDIPHFSCSLHWEWDFDAALDRLKDEALEIGFIDYLIGRRNGIDLIQAAFRAGTGTPLILLTGSADPAVDLKASSAGAADFVCKDEVSATKLSRTIRFALANAQKQNLLRKSQIELEFEVRKLGREWSQLQLAIDYTKHGIALFGADDRLETCNARYLEIFGCSPKDIYPGLSIDAVLWHNVSQGNLTETEADRVLAEHRAQVVLCAPSTYNLRMRNGRTIAVDYRPIASGCYVTTCEDITESLQLQRRSAVLVRSAALADAEVAAKTKFLSNMSHELRTPLNAVIGFADVMRQEMHGDLGCEQYRTYAKSIYEGGQSLLHTVEQVLDMSMIFSEELDIEEEEFLLSDTTSAIVTQLRKSIEQKDILVRVMDHGDPIRLRGDRGKIAQAIDNILDNAVKFCPPHGSIVISMKRDEHNNVVIAVSDTGNGIPEDRVDSVLEPFEQQESVVARRHHGAGLGLPIALGLIRLHGGDIDIDGGWGVGATVRITLPAEHVVTR